MTHQDEPATAGPSKQDPHAAPDPVIRRILAQAGNTGEALDLLGRAYPRRQTAEHLTALAEHAAALRARADALVNEAEGAERLLAVFAELARRVEGPDQDPTRGSGSE